MKSYAHVLTINQQASAQTRVRRAARDGNVATHQIPSILAVFILMTVTMLGLMLGLRYLDGPNADISEISIRQSEVQTALVDHASAYPTPAEASLSSE